MFPTSTSVIPVMDDRSYTPRPLSTRDSVIMASIRPILQEVGKGAFMPGLRPGFPPQQPHVFLSQDRKSQVPLSTAAMPLHEEPLQPLPSKMPQPNRSPAPVSFAVGSELEPLDTPVFRPGPRGIPTPLMAQPEVLLGHTLFSSYPEPRGLDIFQPSSYGQRPIVLPYGPLQTLRRHRCPENSPLSSPSNPNQALSFGSSPP
jgi:hypothetical protein